MASRYRWRQRLLGSLQGQLQLATYLVVFLGFTGASSVGLLIGQRNLLANDQQLARQSIALCDKAIRGLQNNPARLEQELLFHSSANTSLCIEDRPERCCGPASTDPVRTPPSKPPWPQTPAVSRDYSARLISAMNDS